MDPNAVFSKKAKAIPHLTQTDCREDEVHPGAPLLRCKDFGHRPLSWLEPGLVEHSNAWPRQADIRQADR